MGQAATLEMPQTAPGKYPVLPVNGTMLQVCNDMVLEFADESERLIQVVAAPNPTVKGAPTALFRSDSGVDELFYIMPVLMVRTAHRWEGGEWKEMRDVIGVAYSDRSRKLVLLYPAVDVLKDGYGNVRRRESPMLYRAVEPITGKTIKALSICEEVRVTNLVEADLTM